MAVNEKQHEHRKTQASDSKTKYQNFSRKTSYNDASFAGPSSHQLGCVTTISTTNTDLPNDSSMASHRPRLHYRKLDWSKGEMRFLEVRPSHHSINDTIVCKMVQMPVENGVEFIAISSLLGDGQETEKININGSLMPIPAHIAQGLRHARAVFAPHTRPCNGTGVVNGQSSSPRWLQKLMKHFGSSSGNNNEPVLRLWIDCLCLNPEDKREKTHARTIMSRMYWKAQTVVGWVGLKIDQTDAGIKLIRDFDDAMPATFKEPGDTLVHPRDYSPHHEWAKSVVHHFDVTAPGAIGTGDFLNRSFFKRRWIIEEMALAKVATFLIGDAIVSWKQLLRLNIAMEEFKDYPSNVCPAETRPLIHNFPLETIHALLDEFERRKAMEKAEGLNRSLAPSYDSGDTNGTSLKSYEKVQE